MLDRIERALRRTMDQVFGRAFGGALQPAEVLRRLAAEMAGSERDREGKPHVANRYRVSLSPKDAQTLGESLEDLSAQATDALQEQALRAGYQTVGPLAVEFLVTPGLATGEVDVEPLFAPGWLEMRLRVLTGPDAGLDRLSSRPTVVIGRQPDCDLPLTDPDASRQHAALECRGHQVLVRDLGSTNGTYVAGRRIQEELMILPLRLEVGRSLVAVARSRPRWDEEQRSPSGS